MATEPTTSFSTRVLSLAGGIPLCTAHSPVDDPLGLDDAFDQFVGSRTGG
jgi:hypothetical protein